MHLCMNVTCKQTKFLLHNKIILFYSILFYSILFYSILFYYIIFYSILFHFILYFGSNIYPLVIGWKSFTWLNVFSTISECWHVWHSMVYYLKNYVTFYDDILQLVLWEITSQILCRAVLFARLFELAQNFRAIHCDVIMALNIGSTINYSARLKGNTQW